MVDQSVLKQNWSQLVPASSNGDHQTSNPCWSQHPKHSLCWCPAMLDFSAGKTQDDAQYYSNGRSADECQRWQDLECEALNKMWYAEHWSDVCLAHVYIEKQWKSWGNYCKLCSKVIASCPSQLMRQSKIHET